MTFEVIETGIAGCCLIRSGCHEDHRGSFTKTFQASEFARLGWETAFDEHYVSVSKRGVLRGLHFQLPPHDHAKLVTCLDGEVLDVVVDLRQGSETIGQHRAFDLSACQTRQVYIPAGLAHGFYVRSDSATLLYNVTTEYAPEHDRGIRWDSCGIAWPSQTPILSRRDQEFIPISEFKSPFRRAA